MELHENPQSELLTLEDEEKIARDAVWEDGYRKCLKNDMWRDLDEEEIQEMNKRRETE